MDDYETYWSVHRNGRPTGVYTRKPYGLFSLLNEKNLHLHGGEEHAILTDAKIVL